jgi:hypothetical protein
MGANIWPWGGRVVARTLTWMVNNNLVDLTDRPSELFNVVLFDTIHSPSDVVRTANAMVNRLPLDFVRTADRGWLQHGTMCIDLDDALRPAFARIKGMLSNVIDNPLQHERCTMCNHTSPVSRQVHGTLAMMHGGQAFSSKRLAAAATAAVMEATVTASPATATTTAKLTVVSLATATAAQVDATVGDVASVALQVNAFVFNTQPEACTAANAAMQAHSEPSSAAAHDAAVQAVELFLAETYDGMSPAERAIVTEEVITQFAASSPLFEADAHTKAAAAAASAAATISTALAAAAAAATSTVTATATTATITATAATTAAMMDAVAIATAVPAIVAPNANTSDNDDDDDDMSASAVETVAVYKRRRTH